MTGVSPEDFTDVKEIGRAGLSEQSRRGECDIRISEMPQDELSSAISAFFVAVR